MLETTEQPTATVVTSEKWKPKWIEIGRSALTSLYVTLVAAFGQLLEAWIANPSGPFPITKVDLLLTLKVAVATMLGDMYRRWIKPSQTVITITPTPKVGQDVLVKKMDDGSEPPPPPEIPTTPPPVH